LIAGRFVAGGKALRRAHVYQPAISTGRFAHFDRALKQNSGILQNHV
jgi:hypothetical protein